MKVERDQQLIIKDALISEQQVAEHELIRLQEAQRAAVSTAFMLRSHEVCCNEAT